MQRVAIHFGDLTTESKFEENRAAIRLLANINAPLELVIASNHDITLDCLPEKGRRGPVTTRLRTGQESIR
ncbi:uncharacterized protein BDW43DRAFT_259020 [Aspergillus alliaceus]|uniref:uncharacterized protein n=1 Tax=Petromyces alliaceus TaxID=209559 RepID=UPI0012A45A1D|nr:uncharacterized protein BDW43DRAFT_259020 [Aspergillus alliaceus]KAB8239739.1 hypothetical protein BDW43DRAFT_259020 [Aspergillus alliaceus]